MVLVPGRWMRGEEWTSQRSPTRLKWAQLDEALKSMPQGTPMLAAEEAGNFSKYSFRPERIYKPGEAFWDCERILEKHDGDLCNGYREEIDTLLVFAGLFSAVVTAFSVESYKWLQADPYDAIFGVLSRISETLAQNASVELAAQSQFGPPPSVAARVNAYWFVSLTLSLSSALGAILCKQWIREFERYVGLSARDYVSIRQTKFEGLERWKVGEIVSALPILLQLSLAMFSLGVVDLLWHLHAAVAITVCIPAVCTLLFYIATTLLPMLQHQLALFDFPLRELLSQCPYKSPQSLLAIRAFTSLRSSWLHLVRSAKSTSTLPIGVRPRVDCPVVMRSWNDFDKNAARDRDEWDTHGARPCSLFRGLHWMTVNMNEADNVLMHCVWDLASARGEHSYEDTRRGITHMIPRKNLFADILADPPEDACPRALALIHLARRSQNAPSPFIVETVCRNLPHLHPSSAAFLVAALHDHLLFSHDPNLAILLLRAVASYARSHLERLSQSSNYSYSERAHTAECLGDLIVALANQMRHRLDEQLLPPMRGAIAALFLEWLRGSPDVEASARARRTGELLKLLLESYHWRSGPLSREQLRRLCDEQNVEDVAELVGVYCGMRRIAIPWPADKGVPLARSLFGKGAFPAFGEESCSAILTELLRISVDITGGKEGPSTSQPGTSRHSMAFSSSDSGEQTSQRELDTPSQAFPCTTHLHTLGMRAGELGSTPARTLAPSGPAFANRNPPLVPLHTVPTNYILYDNVER